MSQRNTTVRLAFLFRLIAPGPISARFSIRIVTQATPGFIAVDVIQSLLDRELMRTHRWYCRTCILLEKRHGRFPIG